MRIDGDGGGDGGGARPYAGRCSFNARRNEFERIRKEAIVIGVLMLITLNNLSAAVSVLLHSQATIPQRMQPATGDSPEGEAPTSEGSRRLTPITNSIKDSPVQQQGRGTTSFMVVPVAAPVVVGF